jgi:hypothetical protein
MILRDWKARSGREASLSLSSWNKAVPWSRYHGYFGRPYLRVTFRLIQNMKITIGARARSATVNIMPRENDA